MATHPNFMTPLERALDRAETAENYMRARDRADAEERTRVAAAALEAREAAEHAARNEARAVEIEETRRAGWAGHLTSGANVLELEKHAFSWDWVQSQIPATSWAPGDGPEMHTYTSDLPSPLAGADDDDVPSLVKKARAAGLPI